MPIRDIYLKIEVIPDYSPVAPDPHAAAPAAYKRDCMRNAGHEDGSIPPDEVNARRLDALIYRQYLDHHWLIPKPDKIVFADVNEPAFFHRVPSTVIYAQPCERLRIHVKNADVVPHSFHLHGLSQGIDSDGSWPFGTQSLDGRRSDEICPGQTWTYTFDIRHDMIGAWPFHDHYRHFGRSVDRGLFGGLVVLPHEAYVELPWFPLPERLVKLLDEIEHHVGQHGNPTPSKTAPRGHMDHILSLPPELRDQVLLLDELTHAPQLHLIPKPPHPLHVPIFLHRMSGARDTPVFESAPLDPRRSYTSPPFTFATVYHYHCGIQGRSMKGRINVVPGGQSPPNVKILDNQFDPPDITIDVGSQVRWTNAGQNRHSVIESGGDNLPSTCFNGRSFVGNTPTLLAESGQKIRWYLFNLDLGTSGHNFHPHGQRWQLAGETFDGRSLGPAESFVVETTAPPVLLLPPEIEKYQPPGHRPPDARPFQLRGDFPFHCHDETHMRQGLVGLVRATQTVWLTPADADRLRAEPGLPLDPGDNSCPAVDLSRCAGSMVGKWEEVPGLPEVTMTHAMLLANSQRVLFWGYGPRADHSRIWDQATGLYSQPSPQPQAVTPDENVWSGAHAHLGTGEILINGGYILPRQMNNAPDPPLTLDTERRTFFFNPASLAWSKGPETHIGRFYATTITLGDGRLLTLFGQDNGAGGGTTATSLEVFTPGEPPSWGPPQKVPFDYAYYPWTFLLPDGDLFIAGPQKPSRRFAWTPSINLRQQWDFTIGMARGANMDGTAVLLPLAPPHYEPRVLVAGGFPAQAKQTAEWIDLSAAQPGWQALPDMNVARIKLNSVLLPDGRVFIAGGTPDTIFDGGPAELFDPEDPSAGWQLGPAMTTPRRYHSSAILLSDGSVLMGGDTDGNKDGGCLPHERYLPSYFFKPRPAIRSALPCVDYREEFTVETARAAAIGRVVLMRPGAVTHGFDPAQRCVVCAILSAKGTTLQVQAPPHGNVAPPGYYLLFLVDRDRVPSTGVWIKLGEAP
jgi:plastocyanin